MEQNRKRNKYRTLLLGYLLICGAYFGFRTFQAMTMEIVHGDISASIHKSFVLKKSVSTYICTVLHFKYKRTPTDTGTWYDATPQALSFNQYSSPQKTRIIFPKGKPELATIYSLEEFWFPIPYITVLLAVSIFWSIAYVVTFIKPWRQMSY